VSETPSIDRLGEFVNFSVDAIVLVNGAGVIQWSNAAALDVLGYRAEDLVGIEVHDLVEPVDREAWRLLVDRLIDDPATPVRGTFRCRRRDGSFRWTEGVARNLLHEPRVGGIVVYYRDVTDRKVTEEQLKATEDRFGHLFTAATDVMFEADPDGYFRFVNPQTLRLFEYAAGEVIGRRFTEFVRADYRPQVLLHYHRQVSERRLNSYIEFPAITKSGKEVWLGQNAWTISDASGTVVSMQAVARDITERRHAEEGLRAAEAKYRALVEQSLMGVYILQNDRLVYVNPKAAGLLGYTQQELVDSPYPFEFVHEQDRAMLMDQLSRLEPVRMPSVQLAMRGVRKDGQVVQVEAFCSVTEFGNERAILTTLHDISDRVRLEEQLRQAQKMEAVGRLAGGIAHDFNNLLTAIRGNAELMSHRVTADPAMAAEVDEILHAADRAASLTRQLLAFSRKQVLQPVALDLNDSISSVSRMARRLIGTDVQLHLDLGSGLSLVLADPAQVEQVLLNLLVNARDAMPAGGTITVQTSNVRLEADAAELRQANILPGAFVLLNVIDDGIGMDQATQMRIFEPFFTTKETGRGTGLGLSTVYGIIRQTGGAITVSSRPGQGSSFKVYLPAVAGDLR
jgi:two-component system, cell cycle sensor histidine kinase and response regulator CckA